MKTVVCGRWNRLFSGYKETRKLRSIRNRFDAGKATLEELKEAQDKVTALLLGQLEGAGVDLVGDGGFRWDSVYDVARKIKGCSGFTQLARIPETNHFHRQPVARLPLEWQGPILLEDLQFAQKNTSKPIVMCLPGPYALARQTENVEEIGLQKLAEAYAAVLNKEIRCLAALGAALVRVEEPYISHAYQLKENIISLLTEGVDKKQLALASWFEDIKFSEYYFNLLFGTFFIDFVEGLDVSKFRLALRDASQLVFGLINARYTYDETILEIKRNLIWTRISRDGDKIFLGFHTDPHFLSWDEALKKVGLMVSIAKDISQKNFKTNTITIPIQPELKLKHRTFPTSTVGSFPQNSEIRKARVRVTKEEIPETIYTAIVDTYTEDWMGFQEEIDISVPVGGEFLRQDMAAYFGEKFGGRLLDFVPSYENRFYRPVEYVQCLKVPEEPVLVEDWLYLQSLTERPVKETITGPATLTDWAIIGHKHYYKDPLAFRMDFVKALRGEIKALIDAGCKIIQIDEPALTTKMKNFAMDVEALRELVGDFTGQAYFILHICYSDMQALDRAFPKIIKLPFHQIHMEMANRNYSLLALIEKHGFNGKDIGLGVIDVHTDQIETVEEIVSGVKKVLPHFKPEQIWLTPDCGLKERGDEVTRAKLKVMVEAAEICRKGL